MQTVVQKIDPDKPESAPLDQAVSLLRSGKLVAFPTETVYGLGANALDASAVEAIFAVKGRSPANPVIVHVASIDQARRLAADWPDRADRLARRFWPGPLTLVVLKCAAVSAVVTAGGATVALRMPAHPVALALLQRSGLPIAAPSANRSSHISPTTAAHVLKDLEGRIPLVLDAGATSGGLESTVLDLTSQPPRILRPGLVTAEKIGAVLGIQMGMEGTERPDRIARSPGLEARHYAPSIPLECVNESAMRVARLLEQGCRVGWLSFGSESLPTNEKLIARRLPNEPVQYAAGLYAALHLLEDARVDRIVVTRPPEGSEWAAIHDRLRRAARND